MVFVPGGTFNMGIDLEKAAESCLDRISNDPEAQPRDCSGSLFTLQSPEHKVHVDSFWLDQYEFTFEQYRDCIDDGRCEGKFLDLAKQYGIGDGDLYPLTMVTIVDAKAFCDWRGGRLPTEAEWEYAARGINGDESPWGSSFNGALHNLALIPL